MDFKKRAEELRLQEQGRLEKLFEYGQNPQNPYREGEFFDVLHVLIHPDQPMWVAVYDCLHDDPQTGQYEKHYHIDHRFPHDGLFPGTIRIDEQQVLATTRFFRRMKKTWENFKTPTELILPALPEKPTLNLRSMRCPHRGYDLSREPNVGGVITCPLHGLEFDHLTGECLNYEKACAYHNPMVP